ncbi:hypothetical protein [Pseudomonas sp. F01002]|uniref:hypothetical protein n=1 Tax=Pseudomonas sp. F01002 TaxID=2555724 RepID=UPI0021149CC2|nr:hypothetical protein [Pseudomonas sp. F01002]
MNFSSPHDLSPTGTLRSLIQETTVCPPSRGLFFACYFVCPCTKESVFRALLQSPDTNHSRHRHRVYHQALSIRYQLAMSTLSDESRQIVASLAHRVGPNADIATVAQAIASILQDMDAALTPIIGQQGVVALYRRSLHLCASNHPRLAGTYDSVQAASLDLTALKSVLVEQSDADALFFGEVLLTTFYELLTMLIGPSLTARLLRGVWEPSLSDTPSQEISP